MGEKFTQKKRLGRPPTLTPEITKRICEALEMGCYLESAAAYAGVHKITLQDWLYRGRKATKGLYKDFTEQVELAIDKCETRHLNTIAKASIEGNWKASAWMLERKLPKRWGRKEIIAVEDEKKDSFQEDSINLVLAKVYDQVEEDRWDPPGIVEEEPDEA